MRLTLILGPMKSGKSFDLISRVAHLAYMPTTAFAVVQPERNGRDSVVRSRLGASIESHKVPDLVEVMDRIQAGAWEMPKVLAIDEVHMFEPRDSMVVEQLLDLGTDVIACGLDLDHQGYMFDTVKRLLELGPDEVVRKMAVCEVCGRHEAVYSMVLRQMYNEWVMVPKSLPPVLPEGEGQRELRYLPACRKCFREARKFRDQFYYGC